MNAWSREREPLGDQLGLGADSYTAKRLQHSPPAHLHATSLRCFIGPIPDSWLSKHRKSWYRYRPHLSTYSSKTATFDASAKISVTADLSGLDSQSQLEGQYTGPSFPQPDDVSEEQPIVQVEPPSPDTTDPAQIQPIADSKGNLVKSVSFRDGESFEISEVPPSTGPSIPRVNVRRESEGQGSYTTALEDQSSHFNVTKGVLSDIPSIRSTDIQQEHSLARQQRQSMGSSLEAAVASNTKAPAPADSTSSLLRFESGERVSSNPSISRDATARELEAEDNTADSPGEDLRALHPVATGLVHFDLPPKPKRDKLPSTVQPQSSVLSTLFRSHTQPGELIKAERMLVRVDWTKNDLPPGFNENDSMRVETLPVEKWREFMVVCRRRSLTDGEIDDKEDDNESFSLQMSKSRVIPMIDQRRTSSRCAHEIVLQRKATRINMFSSLDKSIVVWSKWNKGTRIYLLRPRTATSAVEWYTFLNLLLGWKRSTMLPIYVPDLNVTLNIDKPFQALLPARESLEGRSTEGSTLQLENAGKGAVSHDLIERSLKSLSNSPVAGNLKTWLQNGDRVGLAWKRYDRLEWVHGGNEEKMYGSMAMQQSHELELRLKQHYPTSAQQNSTKPRKIEEPPAVEGFLIRLTSQKGRHKRFGKSFFKRLYFSTHNQYLCFCQPSKALPPKPPKLALEMGADQTPKASQLAEGIPLIYAVNPYPLKDSQIAWLVDRSNSSVKRMDQLAQGESRRRTQMLLSAQGYINLCHVRKIRKSQTSSDSEPGVEENPDLSNSTDLENSTVEVDQAVGSISSDCVFELLLQNGLIVRLQAYDNSACNEWIKRLRQLSSYWKCRTTADMKVYKTVRQQNLKALDINEEMESTVGQLAQKWEVTRAVASAELFNMCGISCCRSITMSGPLYYKPRLHAKFQRSTVILCDGKLLIFQSTLRKRSGKEIPHIHHERRQILDLEDTYVYSGLATEGDLLYRNQTFDSNNPGHHALPRIYLEDQWTSSDEDTTTCFVIWHRKSRSIFKTSTEEEDGRVKQKLRYVSSLGRPGRSVVFKTRSRAERDHWVTSISLETDRIAQTEDLRLVT